MNIYLFDQKKYFILCILIVLLFINSYPSVIHAEISNLESCMSKMESKEFIYITGFSAFFNYSVNPSEIIVNKLNHTTLHNYTIIGRVLPVNFTKAPLLIQKDIKNLTPSLIVCLGLDPNCQSITLETLSINLQYDASVNQSLKTLERIRKEGPFLYPTRLDVKDMFIDLKRNDIPVSLSFSAGLYVCNTVFYETLFYLSEQKIDTPMGFIHVPFLEDVNINGMKLDLMEDGIITLMLSNL